MKNQENFILAIESSCDDTSAAVLCNKKVLSNVVATQEIHKKYGVPVLYVGGEGKGLLKTSLAHIGLAIANAKFHIGSDSGMMHVAQLYKKYEDIHIYDTDDSYKSHHLVRAINNGSKYFKV